MLLFWVSVVDVVVPNPKFAPFGLRASVPPWCASPSLVEEDAMS
jgi:hypothetical protein